MGRIDQLRHWTDHSIHHARQWLFPVEPEHDPSWARRIWLLAVYTFRRWLITDHCSALASSLTVQTLLSVVPTIGVLLFFFGLLDPVFGRQFMARISHALAPDSYRAAEMAEAFVDLATNVRVEALGRWGLVVVIVLSFMLFSTLEKTINEIWRVTRKRNLIAKFTMFYTLATLGPIVVFYSLAQPLLAQVASWVVTPVVTSSVGLILLFRFLPNQTVRWRAAILGGLIAAGLFEVGKFAFGRYLSLIAMSTYEGLYGSLAIMPVFVVWAYTSWMIVLLGAEAAFVVHHVAAIAHEGYMLPAQQVERLLGSPGRIAARVLLAIGEHHQVRSARAQAGTLDPDQRPGLSLDELDERFEVPLVTLRNILDRLEEVGLVISLPNDKGYVPGRALEHIELAELLAMFDGEDHGTDTLGEVFAELDQHQRERLAGVDLRECVRRELERREQSADEQAEEPERALEPTLTT